MTNETPDGWSRETDRTYTSAGRNDAQRYVTYLHGSEDVRIRVAPASLDGEGEPGYTLRVTTYPGLDIGDVTPIRHVLTFHGCDNSAREFMALFAAKYDGPGTLESAVEYAVERTKAPEAVDDPVRADRGETPREGVDGDRRTSRPRTGSLEQ